MFAIVVIYVAINLILIYLLGEQLADDEEDVGMVGVIGKATRIGHHTTVDRTGKVLTQLLEIAQLPYYAEHQFGSRRGFWVRDTDRSIDVGLRMVVNKHLLRRRTG